MSQPALSFKVRRQEPVLVAPARPTPYEFKRLSDIDDQEYLRFQLPIIYFYRNVLGRHDPVKVIRAALSEALVWYYPFAGRLREGLNRKLSVECTGEGVLFIEADADVSLDQFGHELQPPFPCIDELLFDVPGSSGVLGCPLLLIQVTRLICGGFIFALRFNHTMSDGPGIIQFLNVVAEMARGLPSPTVLPVWHRHLLEARNPPNPTCIHREYEEVPNSKATITPLNDMVHRSILFSPNEISFLKKLLPPHLRTNSTFDLLTACLWKLRTLSLGLGADPDEEVRLLCTVNARYKTNSFLPTGYYGNAIAFPAAVSRVDKLCASPLGYAVELVKKAKSNVTEEYMKSVADLMVIKGRPNFTVGSYLVSDLRRFMPEDVDFGWGKATYSGPVKGGAGDSPNTSFYISTRNGIMVLICLPSAAMDKFVTELHTMLSPIGPTSSVIKSSAL